MIIYKGDRAFDTETKKPIGEINEGPYLADDSAYVTTEELMNRIFRGELAPIPPSGFDCDFRENVEDLMEQATQINDFAEAEMHAQRLMDQVKALRSAAEHSLPKEAHKAAPSVKSETSGSASGSAA